MSGFFCSWWNCPLEDVAEHQQADCEKHGRDCFDCMEQADALEESVQADG